MKMYDAASAGVRFAKTGPERCPSDCTATLPRPASAVVSGAHGVFVTPPAGAVVGAVFFVAAAGLSTRAYQYQSATRAITMTRQPALRKQPFIVCVCRGLERTENSPLPPLRQTFWREIRARPAPRLATRSRDRHLARNDHLPRRVAGRGI